MGTTQRCCALSWINPGNTTLKSNCYTASNLSSRKSSQKSNKTRGALLVKQAQNNKRRSPMTSKDGPSGIGWLEKIDIHQQCMDTFQAGADFASCQWPPEKLQLLNFLNLHRYLETRVFNSLENCRLNSTAFPTNPNRLPQIFFLIKLTKWDEHKINKRNYWMINTLQIFEIFACHSS